MSEGGDDGSDHAETNEPKAKPKEPINQPTNHASTSKQLNEQTTHPGGVVGVGEERAAADGAEALEELAHRLHGHLEGDGAHVDARVVVPRGDGLEAARPPPAAAEAAAPAVGVGRHGLCSIMAGGWVVWFGGVSGWAGGWVGLPCTHACVCVRACWCINIHYPTTDDGQRDWDLP